MAKRAAQPGSRRKGAAPSKRRPSAPRKRAAATKPLEYNILLTATLCLLAFGAVMVYSASSARTALQADDAGTTYLVRYLRLRRRRAGRALRDLAPRASTRWRS